MASRKMALAAAMMDVCVSDLWYWMLDERLVDCEDL
jgi:hypothetical protein